MNMPGYSGTTTISKKIKVARPDRRSLIFKINSKYENMPLIMPFDVVVK